MLKNPILLVAVAVLVAAAVWLLASSRQPDTDLKPLTPPAGESLRRQGLPPRPQRADPAAALAALQARAVPPGDAVLRDLLEAALAAKEEPTYRTTIDVPYADMAARQVSDEVRAWIERKMAGLGFEVAAGKPTVVWRVQIDPAEAGAYSIRLRLRSGQETRHEATYVLPAAYTATRLDTTFAPGLSAPPPAAVTAAPQPGSLAP